MKLAEFEQAVKAFQAGKNGPQLAVVSEENRLRSEQRTVAWRQEYQKWLQEADSILNRLHAPEIMGMVKDLWGEGYVIIRDYHKDGCVGKCLCLYSNTFPVVKWHYDLFDRGFGLMGDEEATGFSITAEYYGLYKTGKIIVEDKPLFDLKDADPSKIKRLVKEEGLEQGLKGVFTLCGGENLRHHGSFHSKMDISGESEEIGEFQTMIMRHIMKRKDSKSLPGDIRAIADAVIGELPGYLKQGFSVPPRQLEEWARQVKGPNVIYCQAFDWLTKVSARLPL